MRLLSYSAIALALVSLASPLAAETAQYWFGGQDPVTRADKPHPADWMNLFQPGSPWQQGESRLNAFKVPAQFVLRGTDDQILTVVNTLHQHHIAFAIEMGSVDYAKGECGGGEGFAPTGLIDRVAGRLQKLGLTLDYWGMDEPLWFGHERTWGPHDCAYPVDVVAQRVAISVATMRRYFPNVIIGDGEVVAGQRIPGERVIADYVEFAKAFQRLTGQPLAFMHWDVAWQNGAATLIAPFSRQMHALGIKVGVIIGGMPTDPTTEAWVADGVQHASQIAANPATRPDYFVVQSWQNLPTHMLPETDPGSATFELLQTERLAQ